MNDDTSNESAFNNTLDANSCYIVVDQEKINSDNVDLTTENVVGNILSTVLNRTHDIINSIVAVMEDIENSREELYLCSTRQLENNSCVIYGPDWSLFSTSESLEEITADFSGFHKEANKSSTLSNDVGEMLEGRECLEMTLRRKKLSEVYEKNCGD